MKEKGKLTRREFMKTTGGFLAATSGASGGIAVGIKDALAETIPDKWDDEAENWK